MSWPDEISDETTRVSADLVQTCEIYAGRGVALSKKHHRTAQIAARVEYVGVDKHIQEKVSVFASRPAFRQLRISELIDRIQEGTAIDAEQFTVPVPLAGFNIRGTDLAVIAPVAMWLLLLHLAGHIQALRRAGVAIQQPYPWLALSSSVIAKCETVCTLVLFPPVGAALLAWTVGGGVAWAAALFAPLFLTSAWAFIELENLRAGLVEQRMAPPGDSHASSTREPPT